MVLDQGVKWQQISISPEDAEFLASRRFTVEELCRLFNVPPPIAGDLTHGTFANTETLVRLFATNTLTPWCRKLEAEFTRSVFSAATRSSHKLELDLSGLLRGDPTARWQVGPSPCRTASSAPTKCAKRKAGTRARRQYQGRQQHKHRTRQAPDLPRFNKLR